MISLSVQVLHFPQTQALEEFVLGTPLLLFDMQIHLRRYNTIYGTNTHNNPFYLRGLILNINSLINK